MVKYAFCNEAYENWDFGKTCEHIASCDYDAVEIAPFTLNDKERQNAGKIIESSGLEAAGLHWLLKNTEGMHLTSTDDSERKKAEEFVKDLCRFCAEIGGKVLVWGSPEQRSLEEAWSYEEACKRAADVIRSIAEEAARCGIKIAMEPLAKKHTNFLTTAEETIKFIKEVDHPSVRLHLDVSAMSDEEKTIPQIIKESTNYLEHFHANDPNLLGPGMGEVDYAHIAAALKEVNYNGYVSVEVFDYSPGPEKIATESINYLKKIFPAT